jgi:esterase
MKLNTERNLHNRRTIPPIVLVHGLFGSLDNLGVLARDLVTDHDIFRSICATTVFPAFARDDLRRDGAGSAGYAGCPRIEKRPYRHSMGGKAVMALTAGAGAH